MKHGRASTYVYHGCRCDECTRANRDRHAIGDADRAARLAADPTLAPHGRRSTYANWGCRCVPCTEANSRYCADAYLKRKAAAS